MKKRSLLSLITFVARKVDHSSFTQRSVLALLLCFMGYSGFAQVVITKATGGGGICSNLAANGITPGYSSLSTITIAEQLTSDFGSGSDVFVLTTPAGWQFNTSVAPTLGFSSGGDILAVNYSSFTSTSITITIDAIGTSTADAVTISGLEIQATTTGASPDYLYVSAISSGSINAISTGSGGTDFGDFSLTTASTPTLSIAASPSGAICSGTNVTFTPTETGGGSPSYQWYRNGTLTASGATYSSSTLANGNTIVAVMDATGCVSPASVTSNTITMTVNAIPSAVTVTGGGTACGSTTITASGGTGGTIYYEGTTSGGTLTADAASSELILSSGTYYFNAESAGGCWGTQGSATVTIDPLPGTFTVNGTGSYCAGGAGVDVTLSGSAVGVNYQLYKNGVISGSAMPGTGSLIDFTDQTAGTYTVIGTNNATLCSASMTGSAVVTANALPTAQTMTGTGGYCIGGSGAVIGLASSVVGVNYELYLSGSPVAGSLTPGTGSAISFPAQTTLGTYTAVGINATTSCTNNMTGSVTVFTNALPNTYTVNGGGSYCASGSGVVVGLSSSQSGVNYQLFVGGVATGSTIPGTGSAINFPAQTTAGTYTIEAINATTSCTSNMTGSTTVTINALPTAFAMTGGGAYCAGSTGVTVGLASSASGINYQLYQAGLPFGSSFAGTGSALTFGTETTGATYTAVATNTVTGCTSPMTGSATVTVNPLPGAFAVTGGGSYCVGTGGVNVGISGSVGGINYELFRGSTLVTTTGGTGGAFNFGAETVAGTYTVTAVDATTSCSDNMIGSATITVNPLPSVYTVTGGGSYCTGGSGIAVGLNGSDIGFSYQLYLGGVATGLPVSGTGGTISFGPQSTSGTYTVVSTNSTTLCTSNRTGSASVSVNALPNIYATTGGGGYCTGGTGAVVGLASSSLGVTYQLYTGSTLEGTQSGTGSAISFGSISAVGTYTVIATTTATSCTDSMSGHPVISTNPLPGLFTVTGGGNYCAGGTGVIINLGGSASGINYQLYNGGSPVGLQVAGTGSAITFGLQTVAGTYTAVAINTVTACSNTMTGTASVVVDALPAAFVVTGGGGYCVGTSGVDVGLAGSFATASYQLYNNGVSTGLPQTGTGLALDFGMQTAAGNYTVEATNTTTGCVGMMTGTVTVTINPLPSAFAVTGGGGYCTGGAGVNVGLASSVLGVNYQLFNGVTGLATMPGTGSALNFGPQTAAGTYTIIATNATTGCSRSMTGSVSVTIDPLPTLYTLSGTDGGTYCAGGSGIDMTLSGSDAGTNYALFRGATLVLTLGGTGSLLDFGFQTIAGVYTVIATNSATTCTNNMTGSVTVTINPLPSAFALTGGGGYCSGGTGVPVGLSGSAPGVTYQLYVGGVPTGLPFDGTGSAFNFGSETTAGSYTAVATTTATGCTATMTGSVPVTVNPLPTAVTVTGGGSYCSGGTGVTIGLSGSAAGVNYLLYLSGSVVNTLPGTGSSLNFGLHTSAGTYTAVATNTLTACSSNMTGSATVVVDPLPLAYAVTGGGSYCTGGSGVVVGLAGSDLGISYQLFIAGAAEGGPVLGTGSAITFGPQTNAGACTVVATNSTTGCTNNMTSSIAVVINPLPTVFNVTGGGGYCTGGSGLDVGLSGSQAGISYQLYNLYAPLSAPVVGSGSAFNFGLETAAGFYTSIATNLVTGCTSNMSGGVAIALLPLPTVYNVTGGGVYCAGGTGVDVALTGSDLGVNYQLLIGGVNSGLPMSGTGLPLDFGNQTTAGTYTIEATNASSGCNSTMTGSAVVTINVLPTAYAMTGGGAQCAGGLGVAVGLANSQTGVNYQLYNGSSISGIPVTGSGAAITFGLLTATGTYTVSATNATTGCVNNMNGDEVVTIHPLPTQYDVTGGGSYCTGATGVDVGLSSSDLGVNYQLFVSGTGGATMGGTGSSISYGLETTAGNYTVVATNTVTACTSAMTGTVTVTIDPLPTVYNVSGGGAYCAGTSGVAVDLSGSQSGVNYQIFVGSVATGAPVAGTGLVGAFDLGLQTAAGTYTVSATNSTTGCTSNMTGSTVVSINPAPSLFAVTGGGNECTGGPGFSVGLSGSTLGAYSYQLFNDGVAVGGSVAGSGSAIVFGTETAAGTYTVSATNTGSGCTAEMTGSAVIVNYPLPTVYNVTGGGTYCFGGSGLDIITSGSDVGTNYQVFRGGVPVGTAIAGTGSGLNILETAAGTYTIEATNATTGCNSNMSGSATITITPAPAAITGTTNICIGTNTTLTDASGAGTWSSSNIAVGSIDPSSGAVSGISAGIYNITFTLNLTGCFTANIDTVTAIPTVGSISGTSVACVGSAVSLTDGSTGGVWTSGNTSIASVGSLTGSVTGVTSGTVNITYTITPLPGCSAATSVSETINPSPVVGLISSATSSLCEGLTIDLSDATTGGTWGTSNASVASVNTAGVVTGVAPGTVVVSYSVSNSFGCTTVETSSITVGNPMPSSYVIPYGSATICHGNSANLSVITTGGTVTYQWTVGGIDIPGADTATFSTFTPGVYTCIISNGTCTEILPSVNVQPQPNPIITLDTSGSYLYTGSFATYQWYHNGVAVPGGTSDIIAEDTTSGYYFVVVSDANGCSDTSAYYLIGGTLNTGSLTSGQDIRIYPNPATSILNIQAPVKVFVTIAAPDGRIFMERKEAVTINIGDLADGLYLITIYDEQGNLLKTDRFVKLQ